MESHTKYGETVYLRSADGSALWVNLYIPSTLDWAEQGFTIKQETKFPREFTAKFTITGNGPLDLKLRVPAWIRKGFQVTVNNDLVSDSTATPGTYLSLSRNWVSGDVVDVQMPFTLRIERALDRPDTQALLWGPILLQTIGAPPSNQTYHEMSLYRHLKLDGDYVRAANVHISSKGDSIFTFATSEGNLTARLYYIGDTQAASAYFRRVEPNIVFGSTDTKIENRKRNDGLPRYDIPVANVTSPGTDGPTFLDVVWDSAPFESHDAFVGTVKDVVNSFVSQGVFTHEEGETIVKGATDAKDELEV